MSILGGVVSGGQIIADLISIRPVRQISWTPIDPTTGATVGPETLLVPQVVVEEDHHDELVVTEHPVEKSATITDHAYKRPPVVRLKFGWSSSSVKGIFDPQYIDGIYQQLLVLQRSCVPFTLSTGKRLYNNMLFRSLSVTTDASTEYAIEVDALCQQIILVGTQIVDIPPNLVQSAPQKTGSIADKGVRQVVPAPNFNPATTP